ncbi:MAG: fibronectin type III domain-containing protein [Ilumatobacteraceae bacterium]
MSDSIRLSAASTLWSKAGAAMCGLLLIPSAVLTQGAVAHATTARLVVGNVIQVTTSATATSYSTNAGAVASSYDGSKLLETAFDSSGALQVYFKNTSTGQLSLASKWDGPRLTGGFHSVPISVNLMSSDGSRLGFVSTAPGMDSDVTGLGGGQAYVYDSVSNDVILANRASSGAPSNKGGSLRQISWNGHYVLFQSSSTNLDGSVPAGSTYYDGYYVRDLTGQTTSQIAVPIWPDIQLSATEWRNSTIVLAMDDAADLFIVQRAQGSSSKLGGLWLFQRSTAQLWAITSSSSTQNDPMDLTPDGHWLVISTNDSYDATDQANTTDAYRFDLLSLRNGTGAAPRIVSLDETNNAATRCQGPTLNRLCHEGTWPSISDDGQRLAFVSRQPLDRTVEPITALEGNRGFFRDLATNYVYGVTVPPFTTSNGGVVFSDQIIVIAGDGASVFVRGNSQSWVRSITAPDLTAPIVTGTPDRAPNATGWYRAPVTITWTVDDSTADAPPPTVVSSEGASQSVVSPQSCDPAGNCASGSTSVSLDMTPPVLSFDAPANGALVPAAAYRTPTCTGSDVVSGLNGSCTVALSAPVSTGSGVVYTATASATDVAGNVNTTSSTYTVLPVPFAPAWANLRVAVSQAIETSGRTVLTLDETAQNDDINNDGVISTDFVLATWSPSAGFRTFAQPIASLYDATDRFVFVNVRESLAGDLNNDGDTADYVLEWVDLGTGQFHNVGISIEQRVPTIVGDVAAIFVGESADEVDRNGDGDAVDTVVAHLNLATGLLTYSGFAARTGKTLGENLLVVNVNEAYHGSDVNGDGDLLDDVVVLFDAATGSRRVLNMINGGGATSDQPSDYTIGDLSTLPSGSRNAAVLTADGTITPLNMGVGQLAYSGNWAAFYADERMAGFDANSDGVLSGGYVALYNHTTGQVTNTRISGDLPQFSADGKFIYARMYEPFVGHDLNGDGDTNDNALAVLPLDGRPLRVVGLAPGCRAAAAYLICDELEQGHDSNGDGDRFDEYPYLYDLESGTVTKFPDHGTGQVWIRAKFAALSERAGSYQQNGNNVRYDRTDVVDPVTHDVIDLHLVGATPGSGGRSADGYLNTYAMAIVNERARNLDLNGDGDATDRVLSVITSADAVPAVDFDGDGVTDQLDNCRFVANSGQSDLDGDGKGDACDEMVFPIVTAHVSPAPVNGWHNTPVTVYWTVDDPMASVPAAVTVTAEGAGLVVDSSPSCDPAGNCTVGHATLSIDRTPPIVSFDRQLGSALSVDGSAPTCEASDSLSGLTGSCTISVSPTSTWTVHARAMATDAAGNSTVVEGDFVRPVPVSLIAFADRGPATLGTCGRMFTASIKLATLPGAADSSTVWTSPSGCAGDAVGLTFNPARTKLAFVTSPATYILDIASQVATPVPGPCSRPRWSPDGSSLACGNNLTIRVINVTTMTEESRVDVGQTVILNGLDWLPSGAGFIVAGAARYAAACPSPSPYLPVGVWNVNLAGALTQVLEPGCDRSPNGAIDDPRVGPGGTTFAYLSRGRSELHLANLDGSGDQTVVPAATAAFFDLNWTSDGVGLLAGVLLPDNSFHIERVLVSSGARAVALAGQPYDVLSPSEGMVGALTPQSPSGVTAVVGSHSATVTWLKPGFDGGSPIIGYTVTASPGGLSCSTGSADALSCTIDGLTNGVNYTFTVAARNAVGLSSAEVVSGGGSPSTTATIGTVPSAPTVLPPVVDPFDGTQVTLRWLAAVSDPATPVVGYVATAQPGGQSCSTTGALSCTISGLTVGVDYAFTVVAVNGVGQSPAQRPGAPGDVAAAADGFRSVRVSWSAPNANGGSPITAYTVVASDGTTLCTTASTSCLMSGLTVGESYTFVVTATNAVGTSDASDASPPFVVPADELPPVVTPHLSPEVGVDGWLSGAVSVSWSCSDGLSGVVSCPDPVTVSSEGADQLVVSQPACDVAGNCAVGSVQVSIDSTPPSAVAVLSPSLNGFGWSVVPVTVSWLCNDDLSGVATCPGPSVLSEGAGQVVTGVVTDVAGNSVSVSSVPVSVDVTVPVLSGSPAGSPNAAGWFSGDVTIVWSCSDVLSGVDGACPGDSVISGEGVGLNAAADVSDLAGNSRHSLSESVRIDRTAPVTAADVMGGWSASDVFVSLTSDDNLSGVESTWFRVDGGSARQGVVTVVAGSGAHVVEFWSVDVAGNVEGVQSVSVLIDAGAPSIAHSQSPVANASGWTNTATTVTFVCSAGLSGVASCSAPVTVTTEGAGQEVVGTAVSNAGLSVSETVGVSIDLTAPSITGEAIGALNAAGWFNGPVTVRFTCEDLLSGVATCPNDVTLTASGADRSVTRVAVDAAGNSSSVTVSGINIDRDAPTIVGSTTTSANAAGWFNTPVMVHFDCSDGLSGVVACPADVVVSGDGFGQSVTGVVTDVAGNESTTVVSGINIDRTAPVVSLTYTGGLPVCAASDVLSGLSGACVLSVPVEVSAGVFSVTATATDLAGNVTVGSLTYTSATLTDRQEVITIIGQLSALNLTGNNDQARDKAIISLNKALTSNWWNAAGTAPSAANGTKVFNEFHGALQELFKITGSPQATQLSNDLLAMARTWAVDAIDAAVARNGNPESITQARQQLTLGDQKAAQNSPADAVNAYRQAWDKATKA